MSSGLVRLPPGGSPIALASLRHVLRVPDPELSLKRGLMERVPSQRISLHSSGREALRVAFSHLSARTGRGEVIIPAYGCYSIPAAAVAAGLEVRLVDVDLSGQIDSASLRVVASERAAAVVVGNLFGVAEPIAEIREIADAAGIAVIDDAAQSLGSRSEEGAAGARGDIGVLSFGRSKPLSALGGGALVWKSRPDSPVGDPAVEIDGDPAAFAQRIRAVLRGAAYDLARVPVVLRILAAIPSLGIGTTVYDPGFRRGPIQAASVALAAALLSELDAANQSRQRVAGAVSERLLAETRFEPLASLTQEGVIHPRLAVLAPSSAARDAALSQLGWLGLTGMYPDPLDRVAELRPHLVGDLDCPGARAFCSRLVTVPTHRGILGRRLDRLAAGLREIA